MLILPGFRSFYAHGNLFSPARFFFDKIHPVPGLLPVLQNKAVETE
jgi:hypothetical protein